MTYTVTGETADGLGGDLVSLPPLAGETRRRKAQSSGPLGEAPEVRLAGGAATESARWYQGPGHIRQGPWCQQLWQGRHP